MKDLVYNKITKQDITEIFETFKNWDSFRNKTVFVTGATGLIGSFIIRSLAYANRELKLNLKIVALVRDVFRAKLMFAKTYTNSIKFVKGDIRNKIRCWGNVDYIIHCASGTESKSFVKTPVETLDVAYLGTKNVLEFAKAKRVKSFVYLSSMEVYGHTDKEKLGEDDLGYIDLTNPRSSYQAGKRACEMLCNSYVSEYSVPVKIVRLAQTLGSNITFGDNRLFAYVAKCIIEKKDVVLNTSGENVRSFCYISDVVNGILTVLLSGKGGESYNVSNEKCSMKIRDAIQFVLKNYDGIELKFDINEKEKMYPADSWNLDTAKIQQLGWGADVGFEEMIERLVNSFKKQE